MPVELILDRRGMDETRQDSNKRLDSLSLTMEECYNKLAENNSRVMMEALGIKSLREGAKYCERLIAGNL